MEVALDEVLLRGEAGDALVEVHQNRLNSLIFILKGHVFNLIHFPDFDQSFVVTDLRLQLAGRNLGQKRVALLKVAFLEVNQGLVVLEVADI